MHASGTVYISVDIETAGPSPSDYAMLAIGACRVESPDVSFYVELIPDQEKVDPAAIKISGLDPESLNRNGTPPLGAMETFERWLLEQTPHGEQLIFVAFNASFDWMFIADYFHRYLGRNPFGHHALDIKALYMGLYGVSWVETSMAEMTNALGTSIELSHNARKDAQDQARIFTTLLQKSTKKQKNEGTQ
jgi:DNA polymerase III alpha subunit (gram-positive type)